MQLEHSHKPDAIARRLAAGAHVNYLRDWIYGAIDGAVTTFAVVAGVAGAELSHNVVLILGAANLVADGFSMAASNYSGTKSEIDDRRRLWAVEERHISVDPEGEREEIRQILHAKGFSGDALEQGVEVITADRRRWIEMMLAEEYGQPVIQRNPLKSALATFVAFGLAGAVPLLPYVLDVARAGDWALGLTGVTFFAVGAAKSRWSLAPWWRSGLEVLSIGMAAAGCAFLVGWGLKGLAG